MSSKTIWQCDACGCSMIGAQSNHIQEFVLNNAAPVVVSVRSARMINQDPGDICNGCAHKALRMAIGEPVVWGAPDQEPRE